MPSKSKAQANLMRAAAHDAKFADKVGIDQKTAKEWVEKDRKQAKASKETRPPYLDW